MMSDHWKQPLKADPVSWLLDPVDPSVRYLALVDLLDRPAGDAEVVAARQAIMESPLVQATLRQQKPDGRWGSRPRAYGDTIWRLLFLALLGASPNDAIRRGCDYLLERGQLPSGAFSYNEKPRGYLPCYTANAVFVLVTFGYQEDPRVAKAVEYLVDHQLPEGGWLCTGRVRKTHSCFWGTTKVLRALARLPEAMRDGGVRAAEEQAVRLLLDSELYKANRRDFGPPHHHWFIFGFPLLVESDVLEVLELVAPWVGPDDPRIQEGLALVLSRQDEMGRWPAEKSLYVRRNGSIAWQLADADNLALLRERFGGEELRTLGCIGQPSKWVTLSAIRMLKRLYGEWGTEGVDV